MPVSQSIVTRLNGRTYSSIIINDNVVETLLMEPRLDTDDAGEFIARRVLNVRAKIDENIADLEARVKRHLCDHGNNEPAGADTDGSAIYVCTDCGERWNDGVTK